MPRPESFSQQHDLASLDESILHRLEPYFAWALNWNIRPTFFQFQQNFQVYLIFDTLIIVVNLTFHIVDEHSRIATLPRKSFWAISIIHLCELYLSMIGAELSWIAMGLLMICHVEAKLTLSQGLNRGGFRFESCARRYFWSRTNESAC